MVVDKGDLPRIKARGGLRVLVARTGEDHLPRRGMPTALDRELLTEFALRHGLAATFIWIDDRGALLSALEQGKGDVVAAGLTVTEERKQRVDFTQPVATVQEVVVGAKGAASLPRKPEDLAGRKVHVRRSASFVETLEALAKDVAPGLEIVTVPGTLDLETLVFEVSEGRRPLTVLDSHMLAAITAYNDNIEGLFPIAEGRQIAWAVRKENSELRASLNAFLVEKALTGHTEELFVGDLDGIKERGVLRVITRNNPVTYFLHCGSQMGFDFDLARMLSKRLGVRLEMVVPPSRDLLVPWLLKGRGDVIAASLSVTPERQALMTFSRPYLFVEEMLAQRKAGEGVVTVTAAEQLRGKTVHVRRSSSYYGTLQALQAQYGPITIEAAPEEIETEQLIEKVATGEIALTVADEHILQVELTYRDDVEGALSLSALLPKGQGGKKAIAFGLRKGNSKLKAAVDQFVNNTYRGLEYNMARRRYFENKRRISEAKRQRTGVSGAVSPYDAAIKKFAARYELDWRLMAAQAFQESRFDPKAKSWAGAMGLFQVMPSTARAMGFTNLTDPTESAHAGIKYLHTLVSKLDGRIPFKQRLRFALAGYNAGIGHVSDARRLAKQKGWNPDRWFHNVERAMLLLQKPLYYKRARYGYCRGSEPVRYVSEIQNRYDNYVKTIGL